MVGAIISAILSAVGDLMNVVWGTLCVPIYYLISLFYDVFTLIPQVNLLNDIAIEDIYQRITMIIIIVMAFYISFEAVKYVVQPDTITDKEKGTGKLVQRIVIVILLLAFVPRMFTMAYDLQGRIIEGDFISTILLEKNENTDEFLATLGSNFSANLFGVFYTLNPETCPNGASSSNLCELGQAEIDVTLNMLRGTGSTMLGTNVSMSFGVLSSVITNFIPGLFGDTVISFNGLLALGVGIYVLWSLIVYSVEVGKRYFQLIYLQIIAPIAIMSYLLPKKDGMLSKWTKQCITTYLDLFIRISIINFVIMLTGILHEEFNSWNVIGSVVQDAEKVKWQPEVLAMVYIFLVIGLIYFAVKAPKLLSELFPSSGAAGGGYGLWGTTKSVVSGVGRTLGGVVGAYTGIRSSLKDSIHLKGQDKKSRILSATIAGFTGAKAGFSKGGNIKKGTAAARGVVQQHEDISRKGGTIIGHYLHGGRAAREALELDRKEEELKGVSKTMDSMSGQLDEFKQLKTIKKAWDNAKAAGDSAAAFTLENQYKSLSEALRGAMVKTEGKMRIEKRMDDSGREVEILVDKDGEELNIEYQYSKFDSSGKKTGEVVRDTYKYDEGDNSFAGAFAHVAQMEYSNMAGTAVEDLEIMVPETQPDGSIEDVPKKVGKLTKEEFARFIHKIKDAASVKETKMHNEYYDRVHAEADQSKTSGN